MVERNALSYLPYMADARSAWQAGGYYGLGNVAPLIGSLAGKAVVIAGNANGVFAEVEDAKRAYEWPVIFAVNDVGMYLDRVDHWVSLHGDNLESWKHVRWLHHRGGIEDVQFHSDSSYSSVQWEWREITPQFALSGYFAMQIAHVMGASRIILCGCPGLPVPRFFEARARYDFGYGGGAESADVNILKQVTSEMDRVPEFKVKVRSTSGWTKEYFGGING